MEKNNNMLDPDAAVMQRSEPASNQITSTGLPAAAVSENTGTQSAAANANSGLPAAAANASTGLPAAAAEANAAKSPGPAAVAATPEIIKGTRTCAIVYTTNDPENRLDPYARAQIAMLCDLEPMAGAKIRVMPDVHPGKAGTIGFTATIGEKLMPMLLGIDIGCGMMITRITKGKKEWQRLDRIIRENIPSGGAIRKKPHPQSREEEPVLNHEGDRPGGRLLCASHIQKDRALLSLGTLGGGNHFIEVDTDGTELYLLIHSGSRYLGKAITEYYMNEGQKALKAKGIKVPYELTWLEGPLKDAYIHDVTIAQEYARLNRQIMVDEILRGMKWKSADQYDCPHNFLASGLLRKGAIAAGKGEKVIIPINMRDGVILGTGLGNPEWNYSAPHGAGRIMPRKDVKNNFTLAAFKSQMKGIYSSCISKDTLDEAPFAYRSLREIEQAISGTVAIDTILRPVYNYKAGSRD